MPFFSPEQREEIATILETIAKDGLPQPRDLDVALDAIEATLKSEQENATTAFGTRLEWCIPFTGNVGQEWPEVK